MKLETRTYTDGSVEAIVKRDDGSEIAGMRVSWVEHSGGCEVFKVETSSRQGQDELLLETDTKTWLLDTTSARVPDAIEGIES